MSNFTYGHQKKGNSPVIDDVIKNNVDFLGSILANSTQEEIEVWRTKFPKLPKAIKQGIKDNFGIKF